MRKAYTRESLLLKANWLTKQFKVSPIDKQIIEKVIAAQPTDFEDAVQYHSALQAKADLIISRDTKGFTEFDLPVMTPAEFIARCAE